MPDQNLKYENLMTLLQLEVNTQINSNNDIPDSIKGLAKELDAFAEIMDDYETMDDFRKMDNDKRLKMLKHMNKAAAYSITISLKL